jgi:hypothetical protein
MNVEDSKLYNIEFDDRTDYLYAYVSGDKDSLDISRQYWREIADECRRTKKSKVLIVEDIKESVSTTETYQIASEISSMGFAGIKIAFIDQHIEQQELNEFGELVSTNRGLNVKLFNKVEEAEKWLLSK